MVDGGSVCRLCKCGWMPGRHGQGNRGGNCGREGLQTGCERAMAHNVTHTTAVVCIVVDNAVAGVCLDAVVFVKRVSIVRCHISRGSVSVQAPHFHPHRLTGEGLY